jgi:hypothetical protein
MAKTTTKLKNYKGCRDVYDENTESSSRNTPNPNSSNLIIRQFFFCRFLLAAPFLPKSLNQHQPVTHPNFAVCQLNRTIRSGV